MAYTTVQKLSDYLKRSLTEPEMNLWSTMLKSATKFVDEYCDTTFDDTDENIYRYYDGEGLNEIDIDPCKEVETVYIMDDEIPSSLYDVTDYVLEPINETIKTSIRLKNGMKFPHGAANIRVEGKFTSYDGSIPADVSLATTMIIADYLNGARDVQSETIEGWSVTYATSADVTSTVKDLLAPYRRNLL